MLGLLLIAVGIHIIRYILVKQNPAETETRNAASAAKPEEDVGEVIWEVGQTMERFLQEIGREKPVRFTSLQLNNFTSNYSTRLGFGGFGQVYKG